MKPEVSWLPPKKRMCHLVLVLLLLTFVFAPAIAVEPLSIRVARTGQLENHSTNIALAASRHPKGAAEESVRLECKPRTFQVLPGEPMRLEMTIRADSAASIRLHVPGHPSLKLRAVEKLPVRRTPEGVIVHQRVVVWQALEPGLLKIDELSVETKGQKLLFPEVTITVRDPGP